MGICLVLVIAPGKGIHMEAGVKVKEEVRYTTMEDNLLDLISSMFPPNIVQATIQQLRTELVTPVNETKDVKFNDTYTWKIKKGTADYTNILGLVVGSVVFGLAMASIGDVAKPVLEFTAAFLDIMMVGKNEHMKTNPA